MISGLIFLCALVGVGVVMWWSVINDKVPPHGKTKGLLAMKHSPPPDPEKPPSDPAHRFRRQ